MGLEQHHFPGQTPLDAGEITGLKISSIATRHELDEFEQKNIEEAIQWTFQRGFLADRVFTEAFVCDVHARMFSNVWTWAGTFRKTNKNLGVDHWRIATDLRQLLEDALYWYENGSFPAEEAALRLKHRMVSIHCFPNGNGRHSRLMADIVIQKIYNRSVFTWGSTGLTNPGGARTSYLQALKAADQGDYQPLLEFARS
jgi:Fic-DOC domain mobile mystery protein B